MMLRECRRAACASDAVSAGLQDPRLCGTPRVKTKQMSTKALPFKLAFKNCH